MKHSNIFNIEGFTIVELIVVFTIMILLSTASFASFVTYSRNQAISNEKKNLIEVLNAAKSRAQSQVKPSGCTTLSDYRVRIVSSSSYRLVAVCNGAEILINNYSIVTPIVINSTANIYDFQVLTGITTQGTITITSGGWGLNDSVSISSNGNIN